MSDSDVSRCFTLYTIQDLEYMNRKACGVVRLIIYWYRPQYVLLSSSDYFIPPWKRIIAMTRNLGTTMRNMGITMGNITESIRSRRLTIPSWKHFSVEFTIPNVFSQNCEAVLTFWRRYGGQWGRTVWLRSLFPTREQRISEWEMAGIWRIKEKFNLK